MFLNSDQVQQIYLDELGVANQQPLGINLMQLTIASDKEMAQQARQLIERVQLEETGTVVKNELTHILHLTGKPVQSQLEGIKL